MIKLGVDSDRPPLLPGRARGVAPDPISEKKNKNPHQEPKPITSISGQDVRAIFCRRRHQPRRPPLAKIRSRSKRVLTPRWSIRASTQLIDEFGGCGISRFSPPATSRKYLTSLLTNTRLQFFGNIGVFWTTEAVDGQEWMHPVPAKIGASARLSTSRSVRRYRFEISWSVPTYRLDWIVLG